MSDLRKGLLQLLFSGSYIRRWNDKLRPVELYEIDKQGHKMMVAFLLTTLNSRHMKPEERLALEQAVVERGLFDYLYRLIITDIKPPVFYRIKANHEHYNQLTTWVLTELRPVVEPLDKGFWERLQAYHRRPEREELADRILEAAHLYASGWEYGLIKDWNRSDEEQIEGSFTAGMSRIRGVEGLAELQGGTSTPLGRFATLCGQLRFQIRWSGTPRVPETSVLGHVFLVGALAYMVSLVVGACPARRMNNFFSGLFHDLPELLTRDIISPVKKATHHLPELIRQYELEELERRIFAPLKAGGYIEIDERLRYFLGMLGNAGSEFAETVRDALGIRVFKNFDELQQYGNRDELDPKDGALLKACDNLAAFLEAHVSVRNGVSTGSLYEALTRIRTDFRQSTFGNLSLATVIADFD